MDQYFVVLPVFSLSKFREILNSSDVMRHGLYGSSFAVRGLLDDYAFKLTFRLLKSNF